MTKTALLKLLLAIVITFILILPEYFKTPQGNILELSCLEVCLQPNRTYSLPSSNFSYVTFLEPVKETEAIMGIFPNHSSFQNFTRTCQDISSEFTMCSSCLICESKGNMDFISQEQTSQGKCKGKVRIKLIEDKWPYSVIRDINSIFQLGVHWQWDAPWAALVLIMRGSMEVKANDFHSACQHFNFIVEPTVDHLEEYNITCNLKANARSLAIMEEDPAKEKSMNRTCRIMNYPNNCIHISLHLEMDVKNFYCSMKITWYILVIFVFIFLLLFTIHKILEVHRQMQKWQSHKYKPSSILLRGSDSEKLRTLKAQALSGTMQRTPLRPVKEVLPPIPELEVPSLVHQQEQYMRSRYPSRD